MFRKIEIFLLIYLFEHEKLHAREFSVLRGYQFESNPSIYLTIKFKDKCLHPYRNTVSCELGRNRRGKNWLL